MAIEPDIKLNPETIEVANNRCEELEIWILGNPNLWQFGLISYVYVFVYTSQLITIYYKAVSYFR